jgi:lysozyme
MTVNNETIALIKRFEGLYSAHKNGLRPQNPNLKTALVYPYLCPANVPTIGYGTTFYPDGRKVKMSDSPITVQDADVIFTKIINNFAKEVQRLTNRELGENQFGALVSIAYNIGISNFKKSTLLKKVIANPNDITISDEFNRHVYANKRVLQGLVMRRKVESDFYKKKTLNLKSKFMQKISEFITVNKNKLLMGLGFFVAILVIRKLRK